MEKQRVARQAALVKQLECGCPDSTCADGKTCSHPMRRITAAKGDIVNSSLPSSSSNSRLPSNSDNNNQVSSTTGSGTMLLTNNHSPRVYSRDTRNHHGQSASHNSGNTPPLVLSLSQIQGGGGLLILNSNSSTTANSNSHKSLVTPVSVASFVCSANRNLSKSENQNKNTPLILKQEEMETNSTCIQSHNQSKVIHRESKMDVSNENIRQSIFEGITYNRQDRNINHVNQQTEVIMTSAPSTPSKKMDTSHEDNIDEYKHQNYCTETVVLLGTDSRGSLISKSDGSSIISGGFFNETLDLTQEDIQRTLSANMPLCSTELESHSHQQPEVPTRNRVISNKDTRPQNHQHTNLTTEINPMDFIDSCDVVVSPTHVVDDDVFVNLDAFDMLGEFPDLEGLDPGHHELLDVNPSDEARSSKSSNDHHQTTIQMEATANITDYSPEWAYPEGGVKVLVTGPWHSSGPYTVLFDTFPVPTTLVQSGVLRCHCPGM